LSDSGERPKKARIAVVERKCENCGAILSAEDVMKIKFENGSWETIPLTVCPRCFKERMRQMAHPEENSINRSQNTR